MVNIYSTKLTMMTVDIVLHANAQKGTVLAGSNF